MTSSVSVIEVGLENEVFIADPHDRNGGEWHTGSDIMDRPAWECESQVLRWYFTGNKPTPLAM